jgi:hypothetical protein
MSDYRLRELERAYQGSGSLADLKSLNVLRRRMRLPLHYPDNHLGLWVEDLLDALTEVTNKSPGSPIRSELCHHGRRRPLIARKYVGDYENLDVTVEVVHRSRSARAPTAVTKDLIFIVRFDFRATQCFDDQDRHYPMRTVTKLNPCKNIFPLCFLFYGNRTSMKKGRGRTETIPPLVDVRDILDIASQESHKCLEKQLAIYTKQLNSFNLDKEADIDYTDAILYLIATLEAMGLEDDQILSYPTINETIFSSNFEDFIILAFNQGLSKDLVDMIIPFKSYDIPYYEDPSANIYAEAGARLRKKKLRGVTYWYIDLTAHVGSFPPYGDNDDIDDEHNYPLQILEGAACGLFRDILPDTNTKCKIKPDKRAGQYSSKVTLSGRISVSLLKELIYQVQHQSY